MKRKTIFHINLVYQLLDWLNKHLMLIIMSDDRHNFVDNLTKHDLTGRRPGKKNIEGR